MKVELSSDEAKIVEACICKIRAISGGIDRTGSMTAQELEFLDSIRVKIRRAYDGQDKAEEAFNKTHGKTRSKAPVQQD